MSCLSNSKAAESLVSDPCRCPDTSTGSLVMVPVSLEQRTEIPLTPPSNFRRGALNGGLMRSTRASPASMSTPASRYRRKALVGVLKVDPLRCLTILTGVVERLITSGCDYADPRRVQITPEKQSSRNVLNRAGRHGLWPGWPSAQAC